MATSISMGRIASVASRRMSKADKNASPPFEKRADLIGPLWLDARHVKVEAYDLYDGADVFQVFLLLLQIAKPRAQLDKAYIKGLCVMALPVADKFLRLAALKRAAGKLLDLLPVRYAAVILPP
jgi:hypothetical protein